MAPSRRQRHWVGAWQELARTRRSRSRHLSRRPLGTVRLTPSPTPEARSERGPPSRSRAEGPEEATEETTAATAAEEEGGEKIRRAEEADAPREVQEMAERRRPEEGLAVRRCPETKMMEAILPLEEEEEVVARRPPRRTPGATAGSRRPT